MPRVKARSVLVDAVAWVYSRPEARIPGIALRRSIIVVEWLGQIGRFPML